MRLSEAMMLGAATCKMIPCDINTCALGAAGNAVGIPQWQQSGNRHEDMNRQGDRLNKICEVWPWLYSFGSSNIFRKFDSNVCDGKMTYEQLVDYVRSVEPTCGDCNEFECSCSKDAITTEVDAIVSMLPSRKEVA